MQNQMSDSYIYVIFNCTAFFSVISDKTEMYTLVYEPL